MASKMLHKLAFTLVILLFTAGCTSSQPSAAGKAPSTPSPASPAKLEMTVIATSILPSSSSPVVATTLPTTSASANATTATPASKATSASANATTATPASKATAIPTPKPNHPSSWPVPTPGTTWQIQLSGKLDTSYDVSIYVVDLFATSKNTIQNLRDAGKTVFCAFAAGFYEKWRPDANKFPEFLLGKPYGIEVQRWVNIRDLQDLGPLLEDRLNLAVNKGCQGVLPFGLDGYQQDTGFPLSADDQLKFNRWLAQTAHQRGLSIGLADDVDQVAELVNDYDWGFAESCVSSKACDRWALFIKHNKAVFDVEYELSPEEFCARFKGMGFSFLRKGYDLGGWSLSCKENTSP